MLSRWREKAGLWEPLPHEHGARSAGMRMWEGLREHRVRSNPRSKCGNANVGRIAGAQSAEQSEVLQYMEAGGTEPPPHEHGARSAGMRMWGGLREHEGGDIYENVSHQR